MGKIHTITRKRKSIKVQVVDEPDGRIVSTEKGSIYIPPGHLHVVEGLNDEQYSIDPETANKGYELDCDIKDEMKRARRGK